MHGCTRCVRLRDRSIRRFDVDVLVLRCCAADLRQRCVVRNHAWPTRLSLLVSHRASIHPDSDKPVSAVHKFAINDLLLLTATVAIGMMYFASPGKYMTFEFWSGSRGAELTLDSLLTATQVITGWMLVFGSKRVRICGVVLTAAIATMAFTQFDIDIGRYRPWHIELTKFAAFVVSVVVFAFFAFVLRRRYPQLA